jgi:integral membrane protein (TIGR01906 family)
VTGQPSRSDPRRTGLVGAVGAVLVAAATIVVLIGVALLVFLNPVWVGLGQERAEADVWTGWSIETVHEVTNAVLADLILGPPDFDQTVDGVPVFAAREITHLQDVRTVLMGFAMAVVVSVVVLVVARIRGGPPLAWRGIRLGATALIAGVVALGVLSVVAFDTVFEVFHRVFFASGTYTFDPATDRMVQLFPMSFWFETSLALGVVLLGLGIVVLAVAIWREGVWRGRAAGPAAEPVPPAPGQRP